MDHRNILATGFLLLCGAVFVHSLNSANAFPQGPNVSTGSNPIELAHLDCYGANNLTLFSNTSSENFIVSDIWITGGSVRIFVDGSILHSSIGDGLYSLQTGLKLGSGSTISCSYQNGSPRVTVTGYYAH